jgi:hypothetical protein
MKWIQNLLKKMIQEEKKILGRWTIDYCDKKRDKKIDLSNEDHCGPCGQYILNKKIAAGKTLVTVVPKKWYVDI